MVTRAQNVGLGCINGVAHLSLLTSAAVGCDNRKGWKSKPSMVTSQGIPHRPPQFCRILRNIPLLFRELCHTAFAGPTGCSSITACHVKGARRVAAFFCRPSPPTLGATPPPFPAL